jgi:hypothetical protein
MIQYLGLLARHHHVAGSAERVAVSANGSTCEFTPSQADRGIEVERTGWLVLQLYRS